MSSLPKEILRATYEEYAREYARELPLEHFMESLGQSTQRTITLESFDLVKPRRPDLHVYSELLVQYPRRGQKRPGQVVPDNMIVLSDARPRAELSYSVPVEPAPPFWVLEYVSKNNKRKDYDRNMQRYERDLKVRYYLLFNPESQEMTLYRHNRRKYVSVKPNGDGRCAVPELDMEVAILDGWVRFWYQGKLLPLPADLQRQVGSLQHEVGDLQRRLADAQEELVRLRAQLGQRDRKE